MASLRKRFSTWALGGGDESPKRPVSMEVQRGSVDSGYHSMMQKSCSQNFSFPPNENPSKSPPRPLHKVLSTTFGYLADTVRQGAASLHKEYLEKEDSEYHRPDHENPKETPKRHNRRSSLFSSVRSRKTLFSPKAQEAIPDRSAPSELSPVATRVTDDKAPSLDVNLPGSSLNSESPERMTSGSQPAPGPKVLWPSPRSVAVGLDDPYIDRDDLSVRVRSFVASALAARPSPMASTPYLHPDDKGYTAETESGAEPSEGEAGFSPNEKQADSTLPATSNPVNNHQQMTPDVRLLDGSGSPARSTLRFQESSGLGLNPATRPQLNLRPLKAKQNGGRLPSELYEADAELSETSTEVTPSMGSRTKWEQARADRDRRYLAAIGGIHNLHDGLPAQVQLPKSPTRSLVTHLNEGSTSLEAIGERIPEISYPTGTLNYAVEAAERRSGIDLADEEDSMSRYLKGRIVSPMLSMNLTIEDIMAFGGSGDKENHDTQHLLSDSETDISDNSPSQQPAVPQPEDAYEAGLRAAGLAVRSYPKQPYVTVSEDMGQAPSNRDIPTRQRTPVGHFRSVSNLSEVTNDSCAVTTSSPVCDAPPLFPALHVRSEPACRSPSAIGALNATEKVEIPLTGPANTGLKASPPEPDDGLNARHEDDTLLMPATNELNESSPRMTADDPMAQKVKTPDTTPQKPFNAARLPNFASPSPVGSSPKSKKSLRREKKARGRVPFAETTGNAIKGEQSPKKIDSPKFTVKHFKSQSGDSSPYIGYEFDPVFFEPPLVQEHPGSSPSANEKKAVCFAEDIEIIGHDGGVGRDPPNDADEGGGAVDKKLVEKELEEKQELALERLMKRLEGGGLGDDKENMDVGEGTKADKEKPRWRVPSKVTGS